jgi:hypothetical protein
MTTKKFSDNNSENPKVQFEKMDAKGLPPASANQIFQAGLDEVEEKIAMARQFVGGVYQAKIRWPELKPLIMPRAASTVTELNKVRLVDTTPLPDLPILVEIDNGFVCSTARARGGDGSVLESLALSGIVFQRTAEAFGEDQPEVRLILGELQLGLERFSEIFELETGHVGAEKEMDRLAKIAKSNRLDYEKQLAAVPPPIDPQDRLGAAIATGVMQALQAMGIKAQVPK